MLVELHPESILNIMPEWCRYNKLIATFVVLDNIISMDGPMAASMVFVAACFTGDPLNAQMCAMCSSRIE
jgi:hypothetical protein